MSAKRTTTAGRIAAGLAFLSPNLLGFLVFTAVPLVISFLMAFTNWDIRRHNMFSGESVQFVGLDNFRRLLAEPDFMQYFQNTLFLMLGIPLGIAGSLVAALLLSRDLGSGGGRVRIWLVSSAAMTGGMCLLVALGCAATATTVFIVALGATILVGGAAGGSTVHRALFYSPCFTAGVATYLLWKKMYNPNTGPVNNVLAPCLSRLEAAVKAVPPSWVQLAGLACAALAGLLVLRSAWGLSRAWRDGEAGLATTLVSAGLLAVPVAMASAWTPGPLAAGLVLAAGAAGAALLVAGAARGRLHRCPADYGLSVEAIPAGAMACLSCALLGLSCVVDRLPVQCQAGLAPPDWLGSYHWAKPSLMIMGLWASVGSGGMLLYLAGLSNIPPELYEAADMDGASRLQRFWHITWPQLAPVTFFTFVMSVIGGLQGGFETAQTMTQGGPAGSTTTLSYFIYSEGFVTGRLGYASAVSWALFLLVFVVTMVNWRFGNKYTNE